MGFSSAQSIFYSYSSLTVGCRCGEDEKFLLIYVIFKLQLVKGKCIIFVADIDRCYRLKLYFEQFGIRSCILNSELPVNSRIHVVEEFNRNAYDIIIASDEKEVLGNEEKAEEEQEDEEKEDGEAKEGGRPKKKRKATKGDVEYGVSRGMMLIPDIHYNSWSIFADYF